MNVKIRPHDLRRQSAIYASRNRIPLEHLAGRRTIAIICIVRKPDLNSIAPTKQGRLHPATPVFFAITEWRRRCQSQGTQSCLTPENARRQLSKSGVSGWALVNPISVAAMCKQKAMEAETMQSTKEGRPCGAKSRREPVTQ
jgi:hypothetical protein